MELDWSSLKLIHSTAKKQYSVRGRRSASKRYRLEEIRDDRRRVERSWQQTPHTRGASSEHLRKKSSRKGTGHGSSGGCKTDMSDATDRPLDDSSDRDAAETQPSR
jgi:hypothetical protein